MNQQNISDKQILKILICLIYFIFIYFIVLLLLPHPLLKVAPSTSLALSGTAVGGAKKRLAAPTLSLTLSRRDSHDPSNDGFSAAALSATPDDTPSLDINLEALETPSGSETGTLPDSGELEWDGESAISWLDELFSHCWSVFCLLARCDLWPLSDRWPLPDGEGRGGGRGQKPSWAVGRFDGTGPGGHQGAPMEEVLYLRTGISGQHECPGAIPAGPVPRRSEVKHTSYLKLTHVLPPAGREK